MIRLDRRITLERKTTAQDALGHPVETWSDENRTPPLNQQVWANRRDMTAAERFRANQELATLTSVFTIRWRAGVTSGDHRINDDGVIFDIEGGPAEPPNTRRQWLELTCTAVGV
jgi:SPP1 family predicted phage head-tail adaptor